VENLIDEGDGNDSQPKSLLRCCSPDLCWALVRHWWEVTSSPAYLTSKLSRRGTWDWALPMWPAASLLADVISLLLSGDQETRTRSVVVIDILWLAVSLVLTKAPRSTLWPDAGMTAYFVLSFIVGGVSDTVSPYLMQISTPIVMVVGLLLGLHSFLSIAMLLAVCFLSYWVDLETFYRVEYPAQTFLCCTTSLIMEYLVASSYLQGQRILAEKFKLLDVATDGWGVLDRQTYTFTGFSEKLAQTLGRSDLIGVPLKALVCWRDHDALENVLRSAAQDQGLGGNIGFAHSLLTIRCSEMVFDARLIVHGLSTSETIDICLVVVGEIRKQDSTTGLSSATTAPPTRSLPDNMRLPALPPSSTSGLRSEAGDSCHPMARMGLVLPPPLPSRSSHRGSVRSRSIRSSGYDASDSEVEVEWAAPAADGASVLSIDDLGASAQGVPRRSVALQTPRWLATIGRRDAAGQSPPGTVRANGAGSTSSASSMRRYRNLGHIKRSTLQLSHFEATPVATRTQALQQMVRSCNTGLVWQCCAMHASWQSMLEIINHNLAKRCERLEVPHTDWQCPHCKAMNERQAGEAAAGAAAAAASSDAKAGSGRQWQCLICHKLVQQPLQAEAHISL